VFPISRKVWGFAVGDVCGTGPEAAALTGLARHSLRLLAREGRSPVSVVERLNQAVLEEGELVGDAGRFITLLYGEVEPRPDGSAQLVMVCAGHPLPLILRTDGSVRAAANPQPLLGVLPDPTLYAEDVELGAGEVLLVYTDGGDTRSSIQWHELLDLLKASDVTVYAIGMLEHQSQSTKLQQRITIQQMAETTGGQAFFPSTVKDLDKVYEKVLAEIRAQYTVGFHSTNEKTDGTWRKVEVKVTRKDLRVRSRRGYFAPYKK